MKLGPSNGARAWAGLAAYVVAYDLWAIRTGNETLSTAFAKSVRHPVHRWRTLVAWSYLTGHLFDLIPDRYDPLSVVTVTLRRRK